MATNTFPNGYGSFNDGSRVGGGIGVDNDAPYDEVKTYSAGVAGEANNLYIDEVTDKLYIYHTGAYHEVSGSGADAFQTYITRANTIEDVEPTITEVSTPLDNSTAEINLNDEIMERWVHDGTTWTKIDSRSLTNDGNALAIERANTIEDIEPTSVEAPTPLNGDTAIINLNSKTVEHWAYDGTAWSKETSYSIDKSSKITIVSVDTTLLTVEHREVVIIAGGTGTIVTLPLVSSVESGTIFTIKNSTESNPIINASAGETIDGLNSFSFNNSDDAITLLCDGSEWNIVGSHTLHTDGLKQQGTLTANPTEQGIYFVDGSIANVTLPPATGSQDRYIFHSNPAAKTSTTTYQPTIGEAVNETTNLTVTVSDNSEINYFLDSEVGKWVLETSVNTTTQQLVYTEIGVASSTNAIIAPLDTIVYESVTGAITTDGSTITVNKSGTFEVKAKIGVSSTNPDVVIKINGTIVKSIRDGSIENRLISFFYDFTLGDTLTVETLDGVTLENWLTGANSPSTDMNYCQVIFIELPATSSVLVTSSGAINVEDVEDLIFADISGSSPYILDNGLTWNEVLTKYDYIDIQAETNVHATAMRFHTDRVAVNETLELAMYDTRYLTLTVGNNLATGEFGIVSSGVVLNSMQIRGIKAQKNVIAQGIGIDDVLSAGQALTEDREIDLNGSSLTFGAFSNVKISGNDVYGFNFFHHMVFGSITSANTLVSQSSFYHERKSVAAGVTTTELSFGGLTTDTEGNYRLLTIFNDEAVDFTVTFDNTFVARDGGSCAAVVIPAGEKRLFEFIGGANFDGYATYNNPPIVPTYDTTATDGNLKIGDFEISDQTTSNYIDVGSMRMAWGQTLANDGNTQVVIFPAGGFSVPPTVTMGLITTTNGRELAINAITATQCTLQAPAGQEAKTWFAIGLKP